MAVIIPVSDLSVPELEVYARLTDAQLQSVKCENGSVCIVESPQVIQVALKSDLSPVSLLMTERQLRSKNGAAILDLCGDVPVYTASNETLCALTGFSITRGMLCAMRRPEPRSVEDVCKNACRIAVLDGLNDPSNVGAAFRNAAALGLDAVLLTPDCCPVLYRRCIRVSMGTVFQIPWAKIPAWPSEGVRTLHDMDFRLAAMALDHHALDVRDPILKEQEKLAIVLGSEGSGLSREVVDACDFTVMIPMAREVDSMNVAAASAVAFWELCRR